MNFRVFTTSETHQLPTSAHIGFNPPELSSTLDSGCAAIRNDSVISEALIAGTLLVMSFSLNWFSVEYRESGETFKRVGPKIESCSRQWWSIISACGEFAKLRNRAIGIRCTRKP